MVALFTELDVLVDLLNVGILFVFYMVSNALIVRRHVSRDGKGLWPTVAFLVVCTALSVAFATIIWAEEEREKKGMELVMCGGALVLCTLAFKALVPTMGGSSSGWKAPMMPFVAVASVFLNVFLVVALKPAAFKRFGIWTAGTLLFYVLYSVHAAHDAEEEERSGGGSVKVSQLELKEKDKAGQVAVSVAREDGHVAVMVTECK